MQELDMRKLHRHPPLTDYSAAVARAIAWLGDRYLLARPVNVAPSRGLSHHLDGSQGHLTHEDDRETLPKIS
jgi:hypothetical protein